MQNIYRILTEIQKSGEASAICIITETHGSTPLKAGAKMIVCENKKIIGTIGGGNLEKKVIEDAIAVIHNNIPQHFEHHLTKDHHMCCGGTVKIFIEPVIKFKNLFIFGAGHIGKEVAKLAASLDFHVTLIDERENMFLPIPEARIDFCQMSHKEFLPQLVFSKDTFIAICTHLHEYDREILAFCIQKPFAYLGMIGSKRKVAVTKKIFQTNHIATEKEIAKVDMPMGFDIGGINPSEIALSIVAKLIAVKNKRDLTSETIKDIDLLDKELKKENEHAKECSYSNGCW